MPDCNTLCISTLIFTSLFNLLQVSKRSLRVKSSITRNATYYFLLVTSSRWYGLLLHTGAKGESRTSTKDYIPCTRSSKQWAAMLKTPLCGYIRSPGTDLFANQSQKSSEITRENCTTFVRIASGLADKRKAVGWKKSYFLALNLNSLYAILYTSLIFASLKFLF